MFEDGDYVDIDYLGDTGEGIICGYDENYNVYIVELITRPKFAVDMYSCVLIVEPFLKKSKTRF